MEELYSVADVARIFELTESRIRYWDQTGFISPSQRRGGKRMYAFRDLIAIKAARHLLEAGASLQKVRKSLEHLRAQLPEVNQPLSELRIICEADRIVVRAAAGAFEAATGQVLLEFGTQDFSHEITSLLEVQKASAVEHALAVPLERTAYQWFLEGCRLDEDPDGIQRARAAYEQAIELDPCLAAAYTNLGNLFHRLGESTLARERYERALELDPDQPEARYNRANLLEDAGDLDLAIAEFRQVLMRAPDFADAHYNLALALERAGSRVQARAHWERYLGLDPGGPWAKLARSRIDPG